MKENLGIYYDRSSDFQQAQFEVLCRLISDNIDVSHVKSLLDIGCGSGARTRQCFNIFPEISKVTAFDPDLEMLSAAQAEYPDPRVDYRHMAAEDTGLLTDVYDGVMSNWVLHWVEDKDKMMQGLSQVTQKGSLFMFGTCEKLPSILQDVDHFVRSELRLTAGVKSPFHYLKDKEWNKLLYRYGWKVIKQKSYLTPHYVTNAREYIEHWFSASTSKFLYGRQMEEINEFALKDLIWYIGEKYHDPALKDHLLFYEDVVFTIAERIE